MGYTAKPPGLTDLLKTVISRVKTVFYKKRTNKVESIDQDRFFQNGPLLMCIQLCMHRASVCQD